MEDKTSSSPSGVLVVRKFLELLTKLDLEHPFNIIRFLVNFWLIQLDFKDTLQGINCVTRRFQPWEDCFKFHEPSCESNFTCLSSSNNRTTWIRVFKQALPLCNSSFIWSGGMMQMKAFHNTLPAPHFTWRGSKLLFAIKLKSGSSN